MRGIDRFARFPFGDFNQCSVFCAHQHRHSIGYESFFAQSRDATTHDREKFLLAKVSKQLVRLDTDEIDVCDECGEAISFRRLLARPVTTL